MKKIFAAATPCLCLCLCLAPLRAQPPDSSTPKPWTTKPWPVNPWTITPRSVKQWTSKPRSVKPWKVKPGNPIRMEKPEDWGGSINCVAYSPDGAILAAGGGGDLRRGGGLVWLRDARTGERLAEMRGHNDIVEQVKFSPDGKLLATQSQDGALFLWDVATRRLLHRLGKGAKIPNTMAEVSQPRLVIGPWSPDGKTLVIYEFRFNTAVKPITMTSTIKIFDAASGKALRSMPARAGYIGKAAWTKDGRNLLVDSRVMGADQSIKSEIQLLNGRNGEILRSTAPASSMISAPTPAMPWSPAGSSPPTTKIPRLKPCSCGM